MCAAEKSIDGEEEVPPKMLTLSQSLVMLIFLSQQGGSQRAVALSPHCY